MDGTELAARFSYITNSLGFCGPEEASGQFINYIMGKGSPEKVESSIKKFEGLYPYLSSIAEKSKKHLLDYEVVEAYWIGNKLLDDFNDMDMKLIVTKLMQRGLPKSIGQKLIDEIPSGFLPHHNFNVFYVGVGKTTGSVETTLQNMDNCRVSWGRVVEVLKDKLIVQAQPLKKQNGNFSFGEEETKTAMFILEMLPDVKKGDVVALHWGFAPLALTNIQLENLKEYTNRIFEVMNNLNS